MNCQNVSQAINLLAQVCFTKFFNFFLLGVRCVSEFRVRMRERVWMMIFFSRLISHFLSLSLCLVHSAISFISIGGFSLISFDSICCFLLFVFSFLIAFFISSSPTAYHISNFNMRLVFFGYDFSICQSPFPHFMALCFFSLFSRSAFFFSLSFSSFYSGVVFFPRCLSSVVFTLIFVWLSACCFLSKLLRVLQCGVRFRCVYL